MQAQWDVLQKSKWLGRSNHDQKELRVCGRFRGQLHKSYGIFFCSLTNSNKVVAVNINGKHEYLSTELKIHSSCFVNLDCTNAHRNQTPDVLSCLKWNNLKCALNNFGSSHLVLLIAPLCLSFNIPLNVLTKPHMQWFWYL